MKKLLLLVLCLGLVGCAVLSEVVAPNRDNLFKLSRGMSREEVLRIMGTETTVVKLGYFARTKNRTHLYIENPYRSEILQGRGKSYEFMYYVTDILIDPIAITDSQLTPLVFEDGKLIGWGWSFIKDKISSYELRLE